MENKIEKQNKCKLLIILLVFLVLSVILILFSGYFLYNKQSIQTGSNENFSQENSNQATNLPITSIVPDEKDESTEIEESLDIDIPPDNTNNTQTTDNVSFPTTTETSTNTSQETNQNATNNDHTFPNTNGNNNNNSTINDSTSSNDDTSNTSDTTNNSSSDDENLISPTPPVKPYIVETETSRNLANTQIKYGVLIKTYTTSTYDIYSDGTKTVTSSYDEIEYDKSNYHATTSELLPEARTIRNLHSTMITQVINKVNSYRQEANTSSVDDITNRNTLSINENLCVAACARAIEMAYSSKFSHTRPNGGTFYSILDEMNISYMAAGENIAYGYSSAESVSEGWKNSQGHYQNMISSDFSQIGIGVFKLEGTYYWVQIFN